MMNSEEKWLGNWVSAKLFGLMTWIEFYDADGYSKDLEWVSIRESETRQLIKVLEKKP